MHFPQQPEGGSQSVEAGATDTYLKLYNMDTSN